MAPISDLFSQFLVKRIHENNAFGIWMHVNRDRQDDMYHMANVLTIDRENFERALAISSLTTRDGSRMPVIKFTQWKQIFGLSMEDEIVTPKINDRPMRIQIFRFLLTDPDLVRPYTEESKEAIISYFDKLQNSRTVSRDGSRIMHSQWGDWFTNAIR